MKDWNAATKFKGKTGGHAAGGAVLPAPAKPARMREHLKNAWTQAQPPETPCMPMSATEIETMIKAKIPDAHIELKDLAGDNDHWSAHVVSASFKGKSRVQQHQMVYDALGGRMGGVLHALALTTAVPDGA